MGQKAPLLAEKDPTAPANELSGGSLEFSGLRKVAPRRSSGLKPIEIMHLMSELKAPTP
jgi:hypothetical protein